MAGSVNLSTHLSSEQRNEVSTSRIGMTFRIVDNDETAAARAPPAVEEDTWGYYVDFEEGERQPAPKRQDVVVDPEDTMMEWALQSPSDH